MYTHMYVYIYIYIDIHLFIYLLSLSLSLALSGFLSLYIFGDPLKGVLGIGWFHFWKILKIRL